MNGLKSPSQGVCLCFSSAPIPAAAFPLTCYLSYEGFRHQGHASDDRRFPPRPSPGRESTAAAPTSLREKCIRGLEERDVLDGSLKGRCGSGPEKGCGPGCPTLLAPGNVKKSRIETNMKLEIG
uniref:Uncharacterized protein n=1 Tax=Naja naja TaxID=35670 RepID=A0A8C6V3S2_NAJNA